MIVPRTCTELSAGNESQRQHDAAKPLEDFRGVPAYVLLGDPGAGKTTAFETECEALGDKACPITARDFLTFEVQGHPEWRHKTLFIDGLDEVRAGSSDARTPFDRIRGKLDALGKPAFRLSCREADWLGANDRRHLESVSSDGKVIVLRLDPLTDSNIEEILEGRPGVVDAFAFMSGASERGIGDLLRNPQTLDLLARAVTGGEGRWPASRTETFEMACEQMVLEQNDEHLAAIAPGKFPPPVKLLDAAGRLCAVQLIAGKAGYTLHGRPTDDYPGPESAIDDAHSVEVLKIAFATRLFGAEYDGCFAPVHRQIAEYLGAKYLAQVIHRGLPTRRVIALMTGPDGTVVTELRGLSGWLAAHSRSARADLIERDPVSVGLYGDIREFSLNDKSLLLETLKGHPTRLARVGNCAAFGSLVAPELRPMLEEILQDSNREQGHQTFIEFVLRFLQSGDPMSVFSQVLLEVVRDQTWGPDVNRAALYAYFHICPDGQDKSDNLRALVADIQSGRVSDPERALMGVLLSRLYPHDIAPTEVWNYISGTIDREHFHHGEYERFWDTELLDNSSDDQVAELIDCMPRRHPALRGLGLEDLPLKLLARGLQSHGDQLDTPRLYDWLAVGELENGYWARDESTPEIPLWLEERPELQKALILEGLSRCPKARDITSYAYEIYDHLYGAERPADFGTWCLEQAIGWESTEPQLAEYLFDEAFGRRKKSGLTLDLLRRRAQESPTLCARLNLLIQSQERKRQRELEYQESLRTFSEKRRHEEEKWLAQMRAHETALRENVGDPALLHHLAEVYFESPEDALRDGRIDERLFLISPDRRPSELRRLRREGAGLKGLEAFLRKDPELIDAAVQGLFGTIDREDVPTLEQIFELCVEDKVYYLGWPYLAALEEIERTAPEHEPPQWRDDQIRRALAFYHCDPLPVDDPPDWYRRLLETRPELVADIQVRFTILELRRGRQYVSKLAKLADDPAYARVAAHASQPLLRAFPVRCLQTQLESLEGLLWAAIQYADRPSLLGLIEKKLSRTSMNGSQRVLWLAAGFAIEPETYQLPLREFVQGHDRRIRYLTEFCRQRGRRFPPAWLHGMGISASTELIRIVGSQAGPQLRDVQGWRTPSIRASQIVHGLIQQNLAASSGKSASDALAELISDPQLCGWRHVLSEAQDIQRVIRRDAEFRHPSVEQVCQSLKGGSPANAADLTALVVDRLRELGEAIRKGNTSGWRQYWNVNSHGRPTEPRPENSCRDILLADLQQRLNVQGIDARSEVQHANEKRADICVSCDGFQVPVETKKNDHRDLWSALRNQLIARYTIDPDADGYGIYLVFWFDKEFTQAPPSGRRPVNPEELVRRLKKEATLSETEERKISICVIDVGEP